MRGRIDGFTPAKQQIFFEAIEQGGCLADAAAAARISRTTVARWRAREPDFAEELERRRGLAGGALEKIAWQRAVTGAPETLIRNGAVVQIRVKPSDAMLRLLLQASNPDKFGRSGGLSRREIERHLRRRIEAEWREQAAQAPAIEEVRSAILERLDAIGRHEAQQGGGGQ